jgi:hypothetical protein
VTAGVSGWWATGSSPGPTVRAASASTDGGWSGRPAQAAATAGSSSRQASSSRSLATPALTASVIGP